MSTPVERELKLVLDSRISFESLLTKLLEIPGAEFTRCALQHNLFFDHLRGDAAPERGGALRMRQEVLFSTQNASALQTLRSGFPGQGGENLLEVALLSEGFQSSAWELTFKRGKSSQAGYFQASEWNCRIDRDTANKFQPAVLLEGQEPLVSLEPFPPGLDPLDEYRSRFGDSALRPLGGFYNLRSTIFCRGFSFEFDQTYYQMRGPEECDLEVEVETEHPEEALQCLSELWGVGGTPWSMQSKTKFQRFLELRTA